MFEARSSFPFSICIVRVVPPPVQKLLHLFPWDRLCTYHILEVSQRPSSSGMLPHSWQPRFALPSPENPRCDIMVLDLYSSSWEFEAISICPGSEIRFVGLEFHFGNPSSHLPGQLQVVS